MGSCNQIKVSIANSEEELNEVYRLRYKVFTEEGGDYRYADETTKMYKDDTDNGKHPVFIAKVGDRIIGTVKLAMRRVELFPKDHMYHWDRLSDIIGVTEGILKENCALMERGVIDREYRGSGIFLLLMNKLYKYAAEMGVKYIVGAVNSENMKSISFWQSQGFTEYNKRDYDGTYYFDVIFKEV